MKTKLIHFFLIAVLLTSFFIMPQSIFAAASSPSITYPAYNATVGKADLTVTWNEVAGASSYKLTLKDMTKFSVVIDNISVTGTSYTIPASKFTVDCLYKVSICAVLDSTEKMSESYFYIKKLNQLAAFKIKSPADNTVLAHSDVTVTWDKVAKAISYKISLWDAAGNLLLNKSTGSTTQYKISKASLKTGQKYRVTVIASASGFSDSKAQSNFSIKGSALPPKPSTSPKPSASPLPPKLADAKVTYPQNKAQLKKADINVTWTGDSHAASYKFSFRDLDTNKLIYDGKIVNTTKFKIAASELTEGHKYRLAVCSLAAGYRDSWVECYFTVESSEVQNSILEKAKKMCDVTWKATKNLAGWKGNYTFKAGTSYNGIPYSQTEYRIDEKGLTSKYGTNDFYSAYTRFGITMPKYGNDCSGFVSYCWKLERLTTYTFWEGLRDTNKKYKHLWNAIDQVGTYNVSNPSSSDLKEAYKLLQPGDALLSYKGGHIVLFWKKSGNDFILYEQTPNTKISPYHYPTCRVTTRNIADLASQAYMPIRLNND